jgi:hypothetical protein
MVIRASERSVGSMIVLGLMASGLHAEPTNPPKETPIGTRIPKDIDLFPIDDARPIVTGFGECAAKSNPVLARDFILREEGYRLALPAKFRTLTSSTCLNKALQGTPYGMVRLEITSAILHYVIADALIKSDLANFDPDAIRFAAPLAKLSIDPAGVEAKSRKQIDLDSAAKALNLVNGDLALFQYGECVVRGAPAKAKYLLSTKINSPEEGGALANMMPDFSTCLEKGQEFRTSRLILRGIVAYNYYRLAYAPRVRGPITPESH